MKYLFRGVLVLILFNLASPYLYVFRAKMISDNIYEHDPEHFNFFNALETVWIGHLASWPALLVALFWYIEKITKREVKIIDHVIMTLSFIIFIMVAFDFGHYRNWFFE